MAGKSQKNRDVNLETSMESPGLPDGFPDPLPVGATGDIWAGVPGGETEDEDEDEPEAVPEIDPMERMMMRFMARMETQIEAAQQRTMSAVDDRLAEMERQQAVQVQQVTAQRSAGLIPPPTAQQMTVNETPVIDEATRLEIAASQRKVAFIPKDDPLNPRSLTFDTWVNGQMIRIKRGDVGMLSLGHAIQLARSGHGHVIDMTAWQQVPIPTLPDESIQNEREWSPQAVIPRDMLRRSL